MSLFRMREWWGTTPGANEEFGGGCVAVGNLDNAADGTMKIATGSFSGMLRLYAPREMNFRVEDVMLESELDAPILQLAAGHLLSDANRTALAVLHPRCLAVYSVSAVAQPGSPGSNAQYYSLTLAYEHQLERPACNMVHGAFGGTYGHELICVQSMDGLLTVIEQDRINLERKLSRFLLPGMPRSCSNPKPTPSFAAPVSLILCVCSNPLSRVDRPSHLLSKGGHAAHLHLKNGGRVLQVFDKRRLRRLRRRRRLRKRRCAEAVVRLVADSWGGGCVHRGQAASLHHVTSLTLSLSPHPHTPLTTSSHSLTLA